MAALTLCILCIILIRLRRPYKVVLIPMVFVMAVSVWALVIQLGTFYAAGNWMLLILDVIILVAAVWVVAESVRAMRDAMNSPAITDAGVDEATEVTDGTTPRRGCSDVTWIGDLRNSLRALSDGLSEFYAGPYRATLRRAARDADDLFMMLVMGEALGVPNPASHHTLELLPVMYDRFHDWHRRMGVEHSPVEGLSCC